MPQLDQYIFLHQLITLIFFFFLIYFYTRKTILPKLNSVLKFRKKKFLKLINHDKNNNKLYYLSKLYFSYLTEIFMDLMNVKINKFLMLSSTFYSKSIFKSQFNTKLVNEDLLTNLLIEKYKIQTELALVKKNLLNK